MTGKSFNKSSNGAKSQRLNHSNPQPAVVSRCHKVVNANKGTGQNREISLVGRRDFSPTASSPWLFLTGFSCLHSACCPSWHRFRHRNQVSSFTRSMSLRNVSRGRGWPCYRWEVAPRSLCSTACKCESLGNFASYLCVFPGCSVSNNNPSVPENECPLVVATIHVQPGFTLTIDPSNPDGQFFTIEGSELQLTKCVDYEVSLHLAGCKDEVQ